ERELRERAGTSEQRLRRAAAHHDAARLARPWRRASRVSGAARRPAGSAGPARERRVALANDSPDRRARTPQRPRSFQTLLAPLAGRRGPAVARPRPGARRSAPRPRRPRHSSRHLLTALYPVPLYMAASGFVARATLPRGAFLGPVPHHPCAGPRAHGRP